MLDFLERRLRKRDESQYDGVVDNIVDNEDVQVDEDVQAGQVQSEK